MCGGRGRVVGSCSCGGWVVAAGVGVGIGVDALALAVYGYVVVPPAEGGEVLGGVVAASEAGDDVVDLEPVDGGAGVDGASVVAGEHGPAQGWWDTGSRSVPDDVLSFCGDGLDTSDASDEVDGAGSDPAAGQHCGTLLEP